jgi:hypothetical protein
MKKIVIFGLLIGALLIIPTVKATEIPVQPTCPAGQHYVGAYQCVNTGDAPCTDWSTSTCLSWSTPTCTDGYWTGPWWNRHWICTDYSESTCLAWSESICNAYGDAPCLENGWVGECVTDEVIPTPPAPICGGGISILQLTPQFEWTRITGRQIEFLSSKFGIGGILLGKTSVPFPVDGYGKPIMTWMTNISIASIQSDYLYGYTYGWEEDKEVTYHNFSIPSTVPAGHYYGRVWFQGHYTGVWGDLGGKGSQYPKVFSQEFEFNVL